MRRTGVMVALAAAGLVASAPGVAADAPATLQDLQSRIEKLEAQNAAMQKALESDRISESEPELAARLKAVESESLAARKAINKVDGLDGLKAGASLLMVSQNPWGLPERAEDNRSQLNYRVDATVELPLEADGDIEQKLFAHFRIGQGGGLNKAFENLGHFAPSNASAFAASGAAADDAVPVLGQAWYQAAIPLPFGGFKPNSKEVLEVTLGKMDFFGFFDQNAVAGDEATQFLNSAFVHNPLLDAGGEVGPDANGFSPGAILAYANKVDGVQPWRLSLGSFAAGSKAANYQRAMNSPLWFFQAETQVKWMGGLPGNYRVYAWKRHEGDELNGQTADHTGFGLSADQRFGDGVRVFARYGKLLGGEVKFDQAVTVGADFNGSYWSRGGDMLGVAFGSLRASSAFKAAGGSAQLDSADASTAFSYTPDGAEEIAELYYRYRINKALSVSPDLQWIRHAGANPDADAVRVFSLRMNTTF